MKSEFRSTCPIATALDIIGDKWSLLLVRDMLTIKKKTFKEFSESSEGIAPGILSSRLKWLEENGMLSKQKLPDNQKENIYLLTEKGIELAPVILELILWSFKNMKSQNIQKTFNSVPPRERFLRKIGSQKGPQNQTKKHKLHPDGKGP